MKEQRVSKTPEGLIEDLDDHLYLLRDCILNQERDATYLKAIAGELRVLICFSSGTEGLLWRVAERLSISDDVAVHLAGDVDEKHPLAKGLSFAFVPIQYAGFGPAELPPNRYSLRSVIKVSISYQQTRHLCPKANMGSFVRTQTSPSIIPVWHSCILRSCYGPRPWIPPRLLPR
jgi:hypothetical protein